MPLSTFLLLPAYDPVAPSISRPAKLSVHIFLYLRSSRGSPEEDPSSVHRRHKLATSFHFLSVLARERWGTLGGLPLHLEACDYLLLVLRDVVEGSSRFGL